ncbi:MAG: amidohydrolase [Clostridia bacterium]|nr:amidohydrolase [Clostridia bacterium]
MKELLAAVEKNQQLILDTERYIWKNPETGYKEFKTSAYMAEVFEKLGYTLTMAEGITGFYTVLDTGKPGPEILVLGELDSVICPDHKDADPQTGAVHSCGHNAQCAALVGVAAALKEPHVLDNLCGRIKLCAVPAEELLEIEFRNKLKKQGKIKYYVGKSEFLYRGYFDSSDIAFMVHTGQHYGMGTGSVGCLSKQIIYKGVAAHAGGSPWNGVNALYAANCGLNAVNAIRETFQEQDIIRVHPIVTSGGVMVNAIPETVTLESYVRGKTFEGIEQANRRVNRALCGAALSLGANVEIVDFFGYAPRNDDPNMIRLTAKAAELAIPEQNFEVSDTFSSGSTDMGDLSAIMPIAHPLTGGTRGHAHGSDYEIADPIAACVDCAKLQVAMLYVLLSNNAAEAKKVIREFKPQFASKEEFFKAVDAFAKNGNRITYNEDNSAATVDIE